MKIIEGIDSSLIYISKYLKEDKNELESNGNGLFHENYPPELFARNIIKIIKEQGDYGLKRITNYLEHNENISFRVTDDDRKKSLNNLDPKLRNALEISIDRVKKFQKKTLPKSWDQNNGQIGEIVTPIESVGAYIPAGTAPLLSTVIMTIIPAKVAGVKRTVICTPYNGDPSDNPIIGCAELVGVTDIYNIGGAQAIGALAYGTESINKVDYICGPGNIWVTAAKKEVYGEVGIDGIYGPTETMVIVDNTSNYNSAAYDLLAQSEHDILARPILVSIGKKPADSVITILNKEVNNIDRKDIASHSINNMGLCFIVETENEVIKIANTIAPEHLSVNIEQPDYIANKSIKCGALFIGEHSAEVMADYIAGPSHVMPTGGTARFNSALSSRNFVTITPFLRFNKETFTSIAKEATIIADIEQLEAHANSARIRLQEFDNE